MDCRVNRRGRCRPSIALTSVVGLMLILASQLVADLFAFTLSTFNGLQRPAPRRVVRRAVEAGTSIALSEAAVFMLELDPISGEIDTSGVSEAMGVYAIYDDDGRLQYIGLAKNIQKSVAKHAEVIGVRDAGRLMGSVKVAEMPGQSKDALKDVWQVWIKEHLDGGGELPVGNLPENAPGADPRWRSKGVQAKAPLNLGGVAGITTMPEAVEAVRKAITQYPVVFFMKGSPAMPQCGFSARSVGILSEIGVPFEAVNVLDDASNPGVREAVKQVGNWPTIPQLYVGGQLVGGADILMEMHMTGELAKVLKDATGEKKADSASSEEAAGSSSDYQGYVQLINDPGRPTATKLCDLLNKNFKLMGLSVTDESASHAGDAGAMEMGLTSESHFTVEIVAPDFEGLSRVERQKKVFDVLSSVMPQIHALSLTTKTPQEAS